MTARRPLTTLALLAMLWQGCTLGCARHSGAVPVEPGEKSIVSRRLKVCSKCRGTGRMAIAGCDIPHVGTCDQCGGRRLQEAW